MRSLSAFESAVMGQTAEKGSKPILPESTGPVRSLIVKFDYQSYFDSTLLEKAILKQGQNDQIVATTLQDEQVPGYAVGLHPSSETPIAICFKIGGQRSQSAVITLKPGQIVRPHGLPRDVKSGGFAGFQWGLPFGWLGGGIANLVVFQSPDASGHWSEVSEICFHRARYAITLPAEVPAAARKNWPMRFPWTQALFGTNSFPQQGKPQLALKPTRILMSLRVDTLAAPASMRIFIQSSNYLDLDSAGAVITSPVRYVDYNWGTLTPLAGVVGDLATAYQVVLGPDALVHMAADDGGIALADNSAAGSLAGLFVDIARFGTL